MFSSSRRLPRPSIAPGIAKVVPKLVPPMALLLGGVILADRLQAIEIGAVGPALADLTPAQWIIAVLLTIVSLWAIGQYDVVLHRVMGTGVAPGRARAAGMRATALAQTVGFGSLTGTLVRWRCLPECDLWTVTRLSLLMTLSFLAALGFLAGLASLVRQAEYAGAAALVAAALMLVSLLKPLPGLPGLGRGPALRLLGWTTLDTFAAAAVLWVLLPVGTEIDIGLVITAYLVGLGAGLLSQSPGGVGAFELCLLSLLPEVPQPELVAAVIGYRIVYHLLPAALALALLVRPGQPVDRSPLMLAKGRDWQDAMARAPQAEWGLAHQGARILLGRDRRSGWLVRRSGGTLAAIGQPLGRPRLRALQDHANCLGLSPVLYKCDARTAAGARSEGWHVARVAENAVIDPRRWSIDRPACRGLRRKLKSAARAGLTVSIEADRPPLAAMAAIHADWVQTSGGERGFSMGRFSDALIRQQLVLLAQRDGELVAFATFHQGRHEWTLDLMRQTDAAPAGTMMALVHAAIEAARAADISRLSLAALPVLPGWMPPLIAASLTRRPGFAGLRQFKCAFGPDLEPLYIAAPSRIGLSRGVVEIARAVHHPLPLDAEPVLPDIELRTASVQKDGNPDRQTLALPVFSGTAPRLTDPTGPAHDRRAFPTSRNP